MLSIWSSSVSGEDIDTLTLRAVACALEQVEKLHNWDTGEGVKLQLHLGLGTGPVRGVDLGNHMRREYVVAGEPLKQLSDAEQQASSGQLVVSPAAWKLVSGQCSGSALPDDGFGPGFYVITKCNSKPKLPPHWRVVLEEQMCKETPVPHAALNSFYLYAPGPMRNHMVSGKMRTAASQFREVTMMFIRIGGLKHSDADFLERFQRVVFMICSAVYVFKGSLSRVSIDDKGTCVKVTFGLPPLFHPDDAARAVKCGLLVRDQIRPMRLKANVGITTGTVFIGYVGSNSRGEYTEYGVMVNMAARFMSKATNEVLVNQTTRDKSLQTDKIDYDELEPKPMKGMDEPVKMFRAVARIDANYFEAPLIVKASANDDGRKSHTATDHTASRGSMSTSASSVGMVGRAELVHAIELALHNFGNTGDGFVMLLRGAPGVGKTKMVEEMTARLAPTEGIRTIEARTSPDEMSDYLNIWRQIFTALPRILGATGGGGGAGAGAAASSGASDKQFLVRQIREWLYHERIERPNREAMGGSRLSGRRDSSTFPRRDSNYGKHPADTNFFPRLGGRESNALKRDSTAGKRDSQADAEAAARRMSSGYGFPAESAPPPANATPAPASSFNMGAGSAAPAPASSSAVLDGNAPASAIFAAASACANAFGQSTDRSNASSQQWSQAGASHAVVEVAAPTQAQSDAAHAQVAKFKQHESLLNAVLNDSTFAESDATLALSEDAKSELTMHMLTHILANALEADLSSGSAGAVIIIEDAQWMDSASWTLLNRLVEQIDSVSVVITMAELPGIGGGIGNLGATQIGSAAAAAVSGSGVAHQSDMSKEAAEFLKVPRLVNHEVRPLLLTTPWQCAATWHALLTSPLFPWCHVSGAPARPLRGARAHLRHLPGQPRTA